VALAKLLAPRRAALRGNLKLLFQPAEEAADGALAAIQDGVLQEPPVDAALGFHLWNPLPVGAIGVKAGPIFASADELRIVIRGKGGHGAMPHLSVDAIVVASQAVVALQSLVSRETSPLDTAVLTIGTIHGGHNWNVIADSVTMTGTLRTFDPALRERLLQRMDQVLKGVTAAYGASHEVTCESVAPPVINDPAMAGLVQQAAGEVVGDSAVIEACQSMTADDVAYLLQERPGCYFLVGSANPGKGLTHPHHHPQFDFDEEAMLVALAVLEKAALGYLA
jgi:amidohydrolase